MKNLTYIKPEKIPLKNNPELNEKWVQEKIAEDPSILGLGDLILKDKERIQPRAGRLAVGYWGSWCAPFARAVTETIGF